MNEWARLQPSLLGLGLSRIGSISNGRRPEPHIVQYALDLGINVFDTADIYGQGESERLLGRSLAGQRGQAIICTKVGYRLSSKAKFAAQLKPLAKPVLNWIMRRSATARAGVIAARSGQLGQDFSSDYLESATMASLKRLSTEYIDLLLLHSPPPELESEPVVEALERMRSRGMILGFGISCSDEAHVPAFLEWPGIQVLQFKLTDVALAEEAKARGIRVIAREALSNLPLDADQADRARAIRRPIEMGAQLLITGTQNPDHLNQNLAATASA